MAAPAVTAGVSQDRFDTIRRNLKLLFDFGDAQAIVEVIDNRVGRHPRAEEHRSAALDSELDFDERTFRPVDSFLWSFAASSHYDFIFSAWRRVARQCVDDP